MSQDWEFNSFNLTTPAYDVQYLGASEEVPQRRGQNLTIPAKTGRYLTTNKKLDERRVALAMWVKDVDQNGQNKGTASLLANLDALKKVFATDGTALLKHTISGTVRQAPAEVVSSVQFEPFGTAPFYRYVVEFSMADPLWRAETGRTVGPVTITTNPQNVTLVNNGTYRQEQGTIKVTGEITDPKFTIGSDWVLYTGTVAGGGTLTIDCSNWTATNGTVDVSGDISHDGDLVWLPIPCGTAVTMAVSCGTLTGSPAVTVTHLEGYL